MGFSSEAILSDLVALLVLRWIWALDHGFKVAIFLSDISGAFDTVDRDILVIDLRNAGVSESLCDLIEDVLAPRSVAVIVRGTAATFVQIENQILQGTVLGPPLWNVFFKSVDEPILETRPKIRRRLVCIQKLRFIDPKQ